MEARNYVDIVEKTILGLYRQDSGQGRLTGVRFIRETRGTRETISQYVSLARLHILLGAKARIGQTDLQTTPGERRLFAGINEDVAVRRQAILIIKEIRALPVIRSDRKFHKPKLNFKAVITF